MVKTTKSGEKETPSRKIRRQNAVARLQQQLKTGTKTEKVAAITLYTTGANKLPLTDKDITRINKELVVLKQRAA